MRAVAGQTHGLTHAPRKGGHCSRLPRGCLTASATNSRTHVSALLATEQLSPVAQQLSYLLENQAHLFPAAVDQHLVELATAAKLASSQPLDGKLETRISVLRASEARSAEVAHILGLQVLARCAADGVELNVGVPGLDDEACGGRVTPDSLSRLLPHEPGAVHEMRAHIDAVMRDGASPTAVCRVDAVSGGCVTRLF